MPKFVFGYDRYPGVEVTVQKRRKPGIFSNVNKLQATVLDLK